MKIRRKFSRKVALAVLSACLVLGLTGYVIYAQQNNTPPSQEPRPPKSYGGPTPQDKKDAQDNKQDVTEQQKIEEQAKKDTGNQKKSVNPVITSATQYGEQIAVNAYVAGIFEDGGICTLVATKDTTVTRTSKGFADATTTSCAPFFIERSVFSSPGDWSVVIRYTSSSAEGSSQATTLRVE